MSDSEDVKLDRLRGSSVPGGRIDLGREDDHDTEQMPRFETATDVHKLRDQFSREVQRIERGLDHRLRTMEVMIVGTDIAPGVHAMVVALTKSMTSLKAEIREERRARLDDQRWRDLVAYGSAGATIVCALMLLVLLLK